MLIPAYPSSGSEFGLGAVAEDAGNGKFGTAHGIAADRALLIPKYSCSLDAEMTAYSALVTLVRLFEEIGVDMYFDGELSEEKIETINVKSMLTVEERKQIIRDCLRS